MSVTVCLMSNTLNYPSGGGMFWAYANWALGLRSQGCRVIWMEAIDPKQSPESNEQRYLILKDRLARLDLTEIAICSWNGASVTNPPRGCLGVEDAAGNSMAFPDSRAAAAAAGSFLRSGDLLLVKGSRGIGTEAVASAARALFPAESA